MIVAAVYIRIEGDDVAEGGGRLILPQVHSLSNVGHTIGMGT